MNLFSRRRYKSTDGKASIANLYIEEAYECFILEDTVRETNEGRPADPAKLAEWVLSWKIPKVTAIPSGRYRLLWTRSPKFSDRAGKDVYTLELQGIPGFAGVRFHAGNDPEDTDACQLPGRTYTPGAAAIGESKLALAALESKVCPVLWAGEEVWVTITNEFEDFFEHGNTSKG